MKNYAIFLISMFISIAVLGQNQNKELLEVEVIAPKFTGIEDVLKLAAETNTIVNYIATYFEYPKNERITYEGTEVIRFDVMQTGELTNFNVVNSVSPKIDKEIIKILRTSNGMWESGYNNGKPVTMEKEIALEIKTGVTEKTALQHDFTHKAQLCYKKGANIFFVEGKPEKALKYFNEGIRYKPYDKSLFLTRGLCRYELGYTEGARQDWLRLKNLGYIDMASTLASYNIEQLQGYQELSTMFLR